MKTEDPPPPRFGSYLIAVLLPVVGVVLAIREYARNRSGPGTALLLTSALAVFLFVVIGSSA
ncbi:MAG: hypothetical protein H0W81_06460 [Chloroflexi bacterium]|nr:hypothetical protein [Chloroflexota bacterium]